MKFTVLAGTLTIATIIAATPATAQQVPPPITQYPLRTVPDAFQEALDSNSKNFLINENSLGRQVDLLFGLGNFTNSFRENELEQDLKLLHEVYRDVLNQQVNSGPVLRTRDLPNPFNTTLSGN